MVKINGRQVEATGQSLALYLAGTSYDPRRIAVELNGQIVPKSAYETTVLAEGDVVEIVSLVGGG